MTLASARQDGPSIAKIDFSYLVNPFGHLIRWTFQENFSTRWQVNALRRGEESGLRHVESTVEKNELDRLSPASWVIDCPICDHREGAVCELDPKALERREVIPKRLACTNCGFVVGDSQPFLSEALVGRQLTEARESILNGYGIK